MNQDDEESAKNSGKLNKNKFSGIDYAVGVCAWVGFVFIQATSMSCQKLGTCGAGDMVLFGIIAVAMIVPSWIAMMVFSDIFGSKK